jgi:hypothetical protein
MASKMPMEKNKNKGKIETTYGKDDDQITIKIGNGED